MCFGSALIVRDTHNTPVSYFRIRKTKLLTSVFVSGLVRKSECKIV